MPGGFNSKIRKGVSNYKKTKPILNTGHRLFLTESTMDFFGSW